MSANTTTIDVRSIAPRERHPLIFDAGRAAAGRRAGTGERPRSATAAPAVAGPDAQRLLVDLPRKRPRDLAREDHPPRSGWLLLRRLLQQLSATFLHDGRCDAPDPFHRLQPARADLLACEPGRRTTIAEIAQAFEVSENHLTKVVHFLAQQGWVATVRGKGGGLALGCDAKALVVGEVVRRAEGGATPAECFDDDARHCTIARVCRLHGALREATAAFDAVLDGYAAGRSRSTARDDLAPALHRPRAAPRCRGEGAMTTVLLNIEEPKPQPGRGFCALGTGFPPFTCWPAASRRSRCCCGRCSSAAGWATRISPGRCGTRTRCCSATHSRWWWASSSPPGATGRASPRPAGCRWPAGAAVAGRPRAGADALRLGGGGGERGLPDRRGHRLAIPLYRARNKRNYFFVGVLFAFGIAQFTLHLAQLGVLTLPGWVGVQVAST